VRLGDLPEEVEERLVGSSVLHGEAGDPGADVAGGELGGGADGAGEEAPAERATRPIPSSSSVGMIAAVLGEPG